MRLNLTIIGHDKLHESRDLSANPATSDEVLIGRIANGDRLAMQVLFARHHVRVFRFVLRLVREEATAEDLISEVFLDVWRQAGRFEGRSQVSTWLLAIARFEHLEAATVEQALGHARDAVDRDALRSGQQTHQQGAGQTSDQVDPDYVE